MSDRFLGRKFRVKMESSPASGTFNTIGNMKSTSFSMSVEGIDITDFDSTGNWKELLEGGVKSVEIALAGNLSSNAIQKQLRAAAFAGAILNFKLTSDLGDAFEGAFQVQGCERTGENKDAEQFTTKLASHGEIEYTAEA